ncbi:hypothetical protein VP1G_08764 [Cytospora mali]|uniref:Cyanovirin-N domain-containing protein n=1 Tax=Cytospora mali TaxID=578113 RepID=A0A194VC64_CYTMA|nr:hypothetical protein VP1G_08764 [Valsa mali var. pyri (nom. inval.)]
MKRLALTIAPFAAYLVQEAVAQDALDLDLISSCENLSINPYTGVLSGECQAGENLAVTSANLNECLGWGAPTSSGHLYGITPGSPVNSLGPVENGNFTKNCGPCYIIKKDEKGQTAAQLMCSCSPEGSDFKTEYTLDLTDVVNVTSNGCLECMGVSGDCAPEVPLEPSRRLNAPGDLDRDGFNDVEELLDWLELRAKTQRIPCEAQIVNNPRLLPKAFLNTTYHRCKEDHSLCCYQTYGVGCLTRFEAFLLITGSKYWYRMHYAINLFTLELESLASVAQICKYPGQCDEKDTPPDNATGVMKCDHNPLKGLESMVYDSGT